jgi:raffinose/stachyose/melibiose transport system substrate-binding protein
MSNSFSNRLDRRGFLGLLGATGLSLAATACTGPGATSSKAGSAAPTVTGSVTDTISFAHWRAEDRQVFDKIVTSFVKANPDAGVEQDISPSADYQASALQRLRSGNVGDVFTAFRGAQFSDMDSAGLFTDLSNQDFSQNYAAPYAEVGRADGKQMGLPYQVVFLMPIYNVDLFDKSGITEIPADWDGFLSMCQTLRSKGVVPIAWPGGDPGNAGQLFNSMVMNNAPSPDMCAKIESGEYKCTDDWFLKTLSQYAELRPFMEKNAAGTAPEPLQQMFVSQKAAMLATGSYHIAACRGLGAKFAMDILSPITVPAPEATYQGVHNATFILGLNSASDKQETGVAFLEHLSDPAVASVYANGTAQHVPISGVEYTNPDLKKLAPWLEKDTILAPRYQFLDLDVASAVEGSCIAVVGGKSPEQAAEEAQRVVEEQIS